MSKPPALQAAPSGFPNTPIIDDYGRPTLGPNWRNDPYGWGASSWSVSAAAMTAGNNVEPAAVWLPSVYGPNTEAYCTITNLPSSYFLLGCSMGALGALVTMNGYGVSVDFSDNSWHLARLDGGTGTDIVASVVQAVSPGDGVGIQRLNRGVSAWYRTAGVWSRLLSAVDSTYTAAGYLMVQAQAGPADTVTLDLFGGGTIPTFAAALAPPRARIA